MLFTHIMKTSSGLCVSECWRGKHTWCLAQRRRAMSKCVFMHLAPLHWLIIVCASKFPTQFGHYSSTSSTWSQITDHSRPGVTSVGEHQPPPRQRMSLWFLPLFPREASWALTSFLFPLLVLWEAHKKLFGHPFDSIWNMPWENMLPFGMEVLK